MCLCQIYWSFQQKLYFQNTTNHGTLHGTLTEKVLEIGEVFIKLIVRSIKCSGRRKKNKIKIIEAERDLKRSSGPIAHSEQGQLKN